jgi:hypothetical protein
MFIKDCLSSWSGNLDRTDNQTLSQVFPIVRLFPFKAQLSRLFEVRSGFDMTHYIHVLI